MVTCALAVAWTMALVGWQHIIALAGLADADRPDLGGWGAGGGLPPG